MSDDLATDPGEYWAARRDLTPAPVSPPDESGRHLVLLARVPDLFADTRRRLSDFDCLAVAPPGYLHVTVTPVGTLGDGVPPDAEDRIRRDARDAFADVDAFDARFPRLNLFPTVVYAEVDADGGFAALNDRACRLSDVPVHDRDRSFVPHATLAQFTGDDDYDALVEYLEANHALDATVRVDAVDLVALDHGERFPAFETVETYELG